MGVPDYRAAINQALAAVRAEGRYREFAQCDFDTIGTESVLADIEAVAVINRLLATIGFDRFTISINSRVISWMSSMKARASGSERA